MAGSAISAGERKAEWRYWAAKEEKNEAKRKVDFESLAKERGFYAMLAAQQLGIVYQIRCLKCLN